MIISEITELDSKRVKIFIDGEFAFVLYKGELKQYGIKIGNELSASAYEEITGDVLRKRAIKRAMNLLQKKDYTEYKLREKLAEGLYPKECIDAAIEYVKSYKYLDDERFARDYIAYHIEHRSKSRIIHDLTAKGINSDLVESLFSEDFDDDYADLESEQIKKLLEKKKYSPDMEYKEKQKIFAFIARRGFSIESIKRAMNE